MPKKKLEAELGARRMRRRITYTRPDGEVVVKEMIYTQEKDQDKVCTLLLVFAPLPCKQSGLAGMLGGLCIDAVHACIDGKDDVHAHRAAIA